MTLRLVATTLALAFLVSCGADGEPERPEPRPASGVAVTGTVEIGVAGGS
jgi:hypothetical protein